MQEQNAYLPLCHRLKLKTKVFHLYTSCYATISDVVFFVNDLHTNNHSVYTDYITVLKVFKLLAVLGSKAYSAEHYGGKYVSGLVSISLE